MKIEKIKFQTSYYSNKLYKITMRLLKLRITQGNIRLVVHLFIYCIHTYNTYIQREIKSLQK